MKTTEVIYSPSLPKYTLQLSLKQDGYSNWTARKGFENLKEAINLAQEKMLIEYPKHAYRVIKTPRNTHLLLEEENPSPKILFTPSPPRYSVQFLLNEWEGSWKHYQGFNNLKEAIEVADKLTSRRYPEYSYRVTEVPPMKSLQDNQETTQPKILHLPTPSKYRVEFMVTSMDVSWRTYKDFKNFETARKKADELLKENYPHCSYRVIEMEKPEDLRRREKILKEYKPIPPKYSLESLKTWKGEDTWEVEQGFQSYEEAKNTAEELSKKNYPDYYYRVVKTEISA